MLAAISPVFYLFALACPVGMGLMMLFTNRGMGSKKSAGTSEPNREQSLADLEAEQARLAEKIAALETSTRRAPIQASENFQESEHTAA